MSEESRYDIPTKVAKASFLDEMKGHMGDIMDQFVEDMWGAIMEADDEKSRIMLHREDEPVDAKAAKRLMAVYGKRVLEKWEDETPRPESRDNHEDIDLKRWIAEMYAGVL